MMQKVKRVILLGLLSVSTVVLIGCGNSSTVDSKQEDVSITENNSVKEEKENQPPITIDQVQLDMTILPPDSIGTVYIEASITNNSSFAITGYNATVLLKDKNEKTYLSTYDTVLAGETSPKFTCFGPATLSAEDIEILGYSIQIVDENNETIYLDYDAKLGKYSWF